MGKTIKTQHGQNMEGFEVFKTSGWVDLSNKINFKK